MYVVRLASRIRGPDRTISGPGVETRTHPARLWRQRGGLARPVGVGKGLDANDPPIADGQERGSGLIDVELVRPADDVYDDRYLITGVLEPQRLNPVPLPSRQE